MQNGGIDGFGISTTVALRNFQNGPNMNSLQYKKQLLNSIQ